MPRFDPLFIISTFGLMATRFYSESINSTAIAIPFSDATAPLNYCEILYMVFMAMQLIYLFLHLGHHANRFQMIPLFGAVAIEAISILAMEFDTENRGWIRFGFYLIEGVLIILSIALHLLFPLLQFPKPNGKYQVGTTLFHLVDRDRPGHIELTTKTGDQFKPERFGLEHRHLVVQFWFPIDDNKASEKLYQRAPMYEFMEVIGPELSKRFQMPGFLLNHLHSTQAHAFVNAPMADLNEETDQGFPIVLFSHGNGGTKTQNVSMCEELASNGYVVVAMDHSFDAAAAVFPGQPTMQYDLNLAWMSTWKGVEGMREVRQRQAKMRAGDLSFVLNVLEHLNDNGNIEIEDPECLFNWDASATHPAVKQWCESISGKLDLARVGAVGHSLGGATVIVAAFEDPRVKSVVALDPWMFPVCPEVIESGLGVPLFVMRGNKFAFPPSWESNNQDIKNLCQNTPNQIKQRLESTEQQFAILNEEFDVDETVINHLLVEMELLEHQINTGNTVYDAFIPKFKHHDFHDFKGISPVLMATLKAAGPLPFARSREVVNANTLSFMNKTLRQYSSSLMDASNHFRKEFFPEMQVEFHEE